LKLYQQGPKSLAGLTKPGRSLRRNQMKSSTWSSRLGVGLAALPHKNKPVTENATTINSVVVALCSTGGRGMK